MSRESYKTLHAKWPRADWLRGEELPPQLDQGVQARQTRVGGGYHRGASLIWFPEADGQGKR